MFGEFYLRIVLTSLFPDSPAFLGEKVVGENHVTVIKAEVLDWVIHWDSLMKAEEFAL